MKIIPNVLALPPTTRTNLEKGFKNKEVGNFQKLYIFVIQNAEIQFNFSNILEYKASKFSLTFLCIFMLALIRGMKAQGKNVLSLQKTWGLPRCVPLYFRVSPVIRIMIVDQVHAANEYFIIVVASDIIASLLQIGAYPLGPYIQVSKVSYFDMNKCQVH